MLLTETHGKLTLAENRSEHGADGAASGLQVKENVAASPHVRVSEKVHVLLPVFTMSK